MAFMSGQKANGFERAPGVPGPLRISLAVLLTQLNVFDRARLHAVSAEAYGARPA